MNTSASAALMLAAAFASASVMGGCKPVNHFYKQDTGEMPVVAAPQPVFTPVALPEDADAQPVFEDVNAPPVVLEGDAPAEIQPLGEAAPAADAEAFDTYVIQKGDTLSEISVKLYGTVQRTPDLIKANPDVNPKRMQIGDEIRVPR